MCIKKSVSENGQAGYNVNDVPQKKPPGPFSRFLFLWMFPIYYNGNRRDLDENDLVPPKDIYNSKYVGDKLERIWIEEEINARALGRKPSFSKVLIKAFGWPYITGGILQFSAIICRTISPILFAELLKHWSKDSNISRSAASCYAAAMLLACWIAVFCNNHGNLLCQQFGMKLRIATSSLLYRKIMRMDNGALGDATAGKVVNILSNDLLRFDMTFMFLHHIWMVPLQVVAICCLSYAQAGYASLFGLAVLVILALPLQVSLGRVLGGLRLRTAQKTDERIKLMSEVIKGIQVIKMYAWENSFEKVVQEIRNKEMKYVRYATICRTIMVGFLLFTEKAALLVTIVTIILTGNYLSASVIYPLLQFMNAMQLNFTLSLPLSLSFLAELKVTISRVQELLWLNERSDLIETLEKLQNTSTNCEISAKPIIKTLSNHYNYEAFDNNSYMTTEEKPSPSLSSERDLAVEVRELSASWVRDSNILALKNVSLRIRKKKLCAIVGAVGSGKSSFLQLLLKELTPTTGTVSINGKVSYASQEPWLFSATVRENILFGQLFEPEKYKKVCRVCALEKDFKQFPFGDQSLVGDRGVSLSGGQRARINLARAIYREANIYLLDDPLSAVDANVGRQLFESCINGYLQEHTRILVTHQIHFIKTADLIVVLNEGSVINMGTFEELMATSKDFAMMMFEDDDEKSLSQKINANEMSVRSKTILNSIENKDEMPEFEAQKIEAEKRESGNLRWRIISGYFLSGSHWCFVIFAFAGIVISAGSSGVCDYWISYWSNQIADDERLHGLRTETDLHTYVGKFTVAQYLIIHTIIVSFCVIITNLRVMPFVKLCVSSSKAIHQMMFSTMLRGVMRFFDTSSSGRILNRFAKDIGTLDDVLPRVLIDVIQITSVILTVLVLNAIALYWTLVPSFFLLLIFCFCVRVYLRAAQSIKRLEGTTKSPVFNMVTSSLNGIPTIRSTGAQKRLIEEFDRHQDLHTSAWMNYLGGAVSFGLYLDILCLLYLGFIIFVFLYFDFGGLVAVGSVGLAVTQTNAMTNTLQHGARMFVEFLAQLTCVERVLEYTRIETETNLLQGQTDIPSTWPSDGKITFLNVNLRYAPEEPYVLKNLNINIESGWKVGIVGRTGAGKSSLIAALFRFTAIEGTITIDGIDTELVAKQSLRSKISIIPQEPVLFSATIRYNLDPFNIYSDEEIWRALEQVDLKAAVSSLDFKVTEGGGNFSVGQRQLMCLARAVLRSNKILIMDEATANVDPQTDNFIQQTIRRQFASCTVLTIAHRLNTIMDSDRVLVMDSGQIVEYDYPYILLSNPNSHFSLMVAETGEHNSAQLFQVAKDAYFQSNMKETVR